jgi:hypothetical protein
LRVDALRDTISQFKSTEAFKMDRRPSRRFKTVNTAKVALAVALLIAFLSSIVPLASVSAGSMCMLKCCAGRTPHAAGSCMDGSCQAPIPRPGKAAKTRQAKLIQAEPLCGLAHKVGLKSFAQMHSGSYQSKALSGQTTASAAAFVKPCPPDCGGSAAGFSNSNRQRNSAVIADAVRPRGPTSIHLSDFGKYRTQILDALCRQCAPRGPPSSFS